MDYGFNNLNFDAIHSFTAVLNQTSERIMQKIGLKKIGKFDHPFLEDDDPLKPHVLYMTKK